MNGENSNTYCNWLTMPSCLMCGFPQTSFSSPLETCYTLKLKSKYFCNLHSISNPNHRKDIELIFQNSFFCSQCSEELGKIETIYIEIERLNNEIRQIEGSSKAKLKVFETNTISDGCEFARQREVLRKYLFPSCVDQSTSASATLNSKLAFLEVPSVFQSSVPLSTNSYSESKEDLTYASSKTVDEVLIEHIVIKSHGFDYQETRDDEFDYDPSETEVKKESQETFPSVEKSMFAIDTTTFTSTSCSLKPKPKQIFTDALTSTTSESKSGGNLKPPVNYVKYVDDYCSKSEEFVYVDCSSDSESDEETELVEVDLFAPLNSEVDVNVDAGTGTVNGNRSTATEMSESDSIRRKYKLKEFSVRLERLPIPQQASLKLGKRKIKDSDSCSNTNKNLPLSCPYPGCSKRFAMEFWRDKHFKVAHEGNETTLICKICSSTNFRSSEEFRDHQNIHNGLKPHSCSTCDKTFSTKKQLFRHKPKHVKHIQCEHCGHTFATKIMYDNHVRSHTKERPFICEFCGRSFVLKSTLRDHRFTHPELNSDATKCKFCGKIFSGRYSLSLHEIRHTGKFPFHCQICNRGVISRSVLTKHMKSHLKIKDFECDVCQHKFKTMTELTRHKKLYHPPSKDFVCAHCKKCFSCNKYLQKHEETHKEVKRLLCSLCGKSFAQHTSYKYHMRHTHQETGGN